MKFSLALLSMGLLVLSCNKAGDDLVIGDGRFTDATLTASTTGFEISPDNAGDTLLRLNWHKADFGQPSVITYTLQFDSPADTAAGYDWSLAKSIGLGSSLSTGFTGSELNSYLTTMGFVTGVANPVVFRVRADVNQYNGNQSTIPSIYSTVVVVNITTFAQNLYVPGDYQGWDPGNAPVIAPVKEIPGVIANMPGLFHGYVYMAAPGQHYFKYTNSPDWNHINYGDGGNGTFSVDGNAAGLSVPDSGYYELTADLNTNKWTAVRTSWGIIGDASPGGWDNDTPMTYDPASQTWTVTLNMITGGSWKFRANNGWAINFGISGDGKIFYADNPFFGSRTLNNLTVPQDGNYTITLDLHVAGQYTYSAVRN